MTLLCELTDKSAEQPYFDTLDKKLRNHIPLIFGHQLYKFLYKYLSDTRNDISNIEIAKPNDTKLEKMFCSNLKTYYTDYATCTDILDVHHWFPVEEQLENEDLKIKIENMIKNAKFVDIESLPLKDYVCYIPFCGEVLNKLLYSKKHSIMALTSGKNACYPSEGIVEIKRTRAVEIYNKLGILKTEYQQLFSKNIQDNKYFSTPKFLKLFNDTYYEEVKVARANKHNKELYFYGSDNLVAKEGIDHVLGGVNNYDDFDLFKSLESLSKKDRAKVFLNFHRLLSQRKENDLAQLIQEVDLKKHIVIQGDKIGLTRYFDDFKKINTPKAKFIKDLISGIFVSLLVYKGDYIDREWTLFPLVKHKLLNDILSKTTNSQLLLDVIKTAGEISIKDILENVSFWALFLSKYDEINNTNKKIIKKAVDTSHTLVEKWIINIKKVESGYTYDINSPTIIEEDIKMKTFMYYLLLLIRHSEYYDEPIEDTVLWGALIKYKSGKIPEEVCPAKARVALANSFRRAKEEFPWFKKFHDSHLKHQGTKYWIDFSSLDLDLDLLPFKIDPDFFEDLL